VASDTGAKVLGGNILLQTAAFAALGPRRCAVLALQAVERIHAKGEAVFSEGSPSEGVFLLAQGGLRLSVRTALGGSLVLRNQAAPATIITAGLLDAGPNCATATATSRSTVYVLSRDVFIGFCRRNPDFAVRLLSEIGTHLRRTSAFIDLITASGISQRLARVLIDLMNEAGVPDFVLPCSQTELASRLGTVRELVNRNLRLLEARGVLHCFGRRIVVTDVPALIAAAGPSASAAPVFEPHASPPNPACFVLERLLTGSDQANNIKEA
jgi:CRP-like cAMP-binding protein